MDKPESIAPVVLLVMALLAAFIGVAVIASGPTVTQQIAGLLVFVIAAILFTGSALAEAVVSLRQDLWAAQQPQAAPESGGRPAPPGLALEYGPCRRCGHRVSSLAFTCPKCDVTAPFEAAAPPQQAPPKQ